MSSAYTSIVFTNAVPGGITANKLNLLRDDLSAAIAAGGGGAGTGDMTKAVYDTDNNGKVDTCDSIPWTSVSGKPSAFPPDSTAMLKSVYDTDSNNIVDHAALSDAVPWAGVTGKPSTFPPTSHGSSHVGGAGDPIPVATTTVAGLAPAKPNAGVNATTTQVVMGDDTRLSDTRTPSSTLAHQASHVTGTDQIPSASITVRGLMPVANNAANNFYASDATQKQVTYAMLGGSQPAPVSHAPSHLDNGSDPIPVATTSRTGSLRALNGTVTMFLDGTGNWSTPAPSGTVNPGTWTNLTYSTGWTQNTTAQFRVEINGSFQQVIAQGIINYASGAASLAFTLPVGARPGVVRGCVLAGFDSSGDTQLFQASVATSGTVNIVPMARQNFSWPSATNGSVYLDGLMFNL